MKVIVDSCPDPGLENQEVDFLCDITEALDFTPGNLLSRIGLSAAPRHSGVQTSCVISCVSRPRSGHRNRYRSLEKSSDFDLRLRAYGFAGLKTYRESEKNRLTLNRV
jgi:hypothetical protein